MEGTQELVTQIQQWLREVDQKIREIPEILLYVAIGVLLLTSLLFLSRVAEATIVDTQIPLSGSTAVVGRAFVVHELADDLGMAHHTTGTFIQTQH